MRKPATFILAALLFATSAQAQDAVQKRFDDARIHYDLDAALQLHADAQDSSASALFRAKICLLAAELHRFDYEETPEDEGDTRRELGDKIDVYAEEGLVLLESATETSESHRVQADLYGTMIRSKFKARKYRKPMRSHAERAIELDPENPKARLALAKLSLFAKDTDENMQEALALIQDALEIDFHSEIAWIMRGTAYDTLGDHDQARTDWQRALTLNPNSKLADSLLNSE